MLFKQMQSFFLRLLLSPWMLESTGIRSLSKKNPDAFQLVVEEEMEKRVKEIQSQIRRHKIAVLHQKLGHEQCTELLPITGLETMSKHSDKLSSPAQIKKQREQLLEKIEELQQDLYLYRSGHVAEEMAGVKVMGEEEDTVLPATAAAINRMSKRQPSSTVGLTYYEGLQHVRNMHMKSLMKLSSQNDKQIAATPARIGVNRTPESQTNSTVGLTYYEGLQQVRNKHTKSATKTPPHNTKQVAATPALLAERPTTSTVGVTYYEGLQQVRNKHTKSATTTMSPHNNKQVAASVVTRTAQRQTKRAVGLNYYGELQEIRKQRSPRL